MKSKDLQNVVLSKYRNGDTPTKIYHHLRGATGLRTIKLWCQVIRQSSTISLSNPTGCPRLMRTKPNIKKVKDCLRRKSREAARKIAAELDIARIRVRQILKNDVELRSYKRIMEPSLSADQRVRRKKFANWVRTNSWKEDTMKILFLDEKYLDMDGVNNSRNDRAWAINRADASEKGGVKQRRKHPQKVMVWLGACSKDITPLVIFNEGTVDLAVYIEKVLPVALKYGNQVLGSD